MLLREYRIVNPDDTLSEITVTYDSDGVEYWVVKQDSDSILLTKETAADLADALNQLVGDHTDD